MPRVNFAAKPVVLLSLLSCILYAPRLRADAAPFSLPPFDPAEISDCEPTPPAPALDEAPNLESLSHLVSESFHVPETNRCVQDSADPYDPGVAFTHGKFKDQCIDTSTTRIPVILNEDDQSVEIANFYHEGKYWTAKIPKNAVAQVIFHIVPFDTIGFKKKFLHQVVDPVVDELIKSAHAQFRVKLNPGTSVELTSQSGDKKTTASLKDFIISTTYSAPVKQTYSILTGFKPNYGLVTRVLSVAARANEEIGVDQSQVHEYEMKYDGAERAKFMNVALHDAAAGKYTDIYNLLHDDCTTVAFHTTDEVRPRPEGVKPFDGHWYLMHDEIIHPSLKALEERHLIDSKSRIEDMNNDVTCDRSLAPNARCTEK